MVNKLLIMAMLMIDEFPNH